MTTVVDGPLVALISAVPTAIPPAERAFAAEFPAAHVWNLLDDRLLPEADLAGGLTPALHERMKRLIQHAEAEGADGILLSCSVYGAVAQAMAAESSIPILAPDDAAFAAAVNGGYDTVLVVSNAPGPLADSEERLIETAVRGGVLLDVVGVVAPRAAAAAASGDVEALVDAVHRAVLVAAVSPDAILLGQYSLAPAAERLSDLTGLPVLAGPQRAVSELRQILDSKSTEASA
ncbi:aspartate/glutamate racemase family protein [Rathayibacter sp. VKM Ac-2801]|uniref:aspartate/glutamate racemase family protein n=1 Tax=Rathayibacter sp. VKM Ac-2801 TaxID=2609255 RepID=UPI00132042A3|nr:aspartate/glutamate racemase family protein [Rathayibacter sp. VKM Ac-2801]QHC71731.1 hypothetical protein GSU45_15955 [Rathayibacter sp. VKM Ac-2801]